MNKFFAGTKSTSLCAHCEKKVASTLSYATLSLCEGVESVDNILVYICDECGNLAETPQRSVFPIQQAIKRILESKVVSDTGEITVKVTSVVISKKGIDSKLRSKNIHKYSFHATS